MDPYRQGGAGWTFGAVILSGFLYLETVLIEKGKKGEHITPYVWGIFNGLFATGNLIASYDDPSRRSRHLLGGLINVAGVIVATSPLMVDKETSKKDEVNITATVLSPALLLFGAMVGGGVNDQPPIVIVIPPPIPAI
jgi:hypothetical protein